MNVICLVLLQLISLGINERATSRILKIFFFFFNRTSHSLCCRALACEADVKRPLFGFFARNINYDVLVGLSCSDALQPRIQQNGRSMSWINDVLSYRTGIVVFLRSRDPPSGWKARSVFVRFSCHKPCISQHSSTVVSHCLVWQYHHRNHIHHGTRDVILLIS